MKKIILLFFITIIIPILNYFQLEYNKNYYLVLYYLIFLIISLDIYKVYPNLKLEFNVLFFKYLGYVLLFTLLLFFVFKEKLDIGFPRYNVTKILIFIVSPFLEESIFRYYVFEKLKGLSSKKTIIISALFFAIEHIANANGLFYIFIFGIIFAIYYNKTKNLLMVYLMHLTYNITVMYFLGTGNLLG